MSENREELIQRAKLAEQVKRYDDMAQLMKTVVELGLELSSGERSLVSTAYKHAVGDRRFSRRIISSIEKKTIDSAKKHLVKEYREKIESELRNTCNEVLELLDMFLLPQADDDDESTVFYMKMKGDYYRYLAEVAAGGNDIAAAESYGAYEYAFGIANDKMHAAHPIRLGVALNMSVFYYEILSAPEAARELAEKTIAAATADLDALSEDAYKESMRILQSLRDNLTLWTADSISDHRENKPSEAVTELTEADIINLVELKMREMNLSSLNLKELGRRIGRANPAVQAYFNNDMTKLQEFIEQKCSSFVAIATVEDEVFAFYGQSPRSP